jgi:hypothetical protein
MNAPRLIHVVLEMDAEGTRTERVGDFYTTDLAFDRIQALADTDLFYTVSVAYLDEADADGRLGYRYVESQYVYDRHERAYVHPVTRQPRPF